MLPPNKQRDAWSPARKYLEHMEYSKDNTLLQKVPRGSCEKGEDSAHTEV